ncbi:unnamed protein product [Gadus morhua 'NCC']
MPYRVKVPRALGLLCALLTPNRSTRALCSLLVPTDYPGLIANPVRCAPLSTYTDPCHHHRSTVSPLPLGDWDTPDP